MRTHSCTGTPSADIQPSDSTLPVSPHHQSSAASQLTVAHLWRRSGKRRVVADLAQARNDRQGRSALHTRGPQQPPQRQRISAAGAFCVTIELQAVCGKLGRRRAAEHDDGGASGQVPLVYDGGAAQDEWRDAALQLRSPGGPDFGLLWCGVGVLGGLDGAHKDALEHCWGPEQAWIDERHHGIEPASPGCNRTGKRRGALR